MKNENRYRHFQNDADRYYDTGRYRRFNNQYTEGDFSNYDDYNNNYSGDRYTRTPYDNPQPDNFAKRNQRFIDYDSYRQNRRWEGAGYGPGSNYNRPFRNERNMDYDYDYDRYNDSHFMPSVNRNRGYEDDNYYEARDRNWWDKTRDEVSSWFGDDDAERRRRMDEIRDMNHRGKGPKNYKRSPERIKEDVNDKLSDHWMIDASDIEVDVKGSEVTLNGIVDSRSAKRRAEDAAESVSGVTHVQNNLRVNTNVDKENKKNASLSGGSPNTTYSNGARKKESMSHN